MSEKPNNHLMKYFSIPLRKDEDRIPARGSRETAALRPDRSHAKTMKKNLFAIFIFIGGLTCGYFLNSYFGGSGGSENRPSAAEDGDTQNGAGVPTVPTSSLLVERILPNFSPCWVWADLRKLQNQDDTFSELLKKETVSKVYQEFIASLPQGVTDTLSGLCRDSEEMRLFLLPPSLDTGHPSFVAAFKQPNSATAEALRPLQDNWAAAKSDSSTSEIQVGPMKMEVYTTPFGELACAFDSGIVWVCTPKNAMAPLWSSPPPAEMRDKPGPQEHSLSQYPDTVVALFFNPIQAGVAAMGPPGMIPQLLTAGGMDHVACLYQFKGSDAQLTVIAPGDTPPPWVSTWDPIQRFPFTDSDPVGLIEIALRLPDLFSPASATGTTHVSTERYFGFVQTAQADTLEDDPSEEAESNQPPVLIAKNIDGKDKTKKILKELKAASGETTKDKSKDKPKDKNKDKNKTANPPSGGSSSAIQSPMNAPSPNMGRTPGTPVKPEKIKPKSVPLTPDLFGPYAPIFQLFPPKHIVGVNLFGFHNGMPSLALLFPNTDSGSDIIKQLQKSSFLESSNTEVAKIPGTLFKFGNNPMFHLLGLTQLIALERDANTYLFDEEESAKNYFGEINSDPAGKNRRSLGMRALLKQVRAPAQLEGVISQDLFSQIVEMEKNRIPKNAEFAKELTDLLNEIQTFVKPMPFSAGFRDKEWFLDTYVASHTAQLVDTTLLGIAIYRMMGH